MSVFKPLCRPLCADAGGQQSRRNDSGQLILFDGSGTAIYLLKQQIPACVSFPRFTDLFSAGQDPEILPVYVGNLNGVDCFAAEFNSNMILPEETCIYPEKLRMAYHYFTPAQSNAVARAKELLFWRKQHRYCGCCKNPLAESLTDIALLCQVCGSRYYPQIAPAVIVGITRGNEILLAHNKRFENNIYGLIAGFVEAGESVEQAIEREIGEEVGIRVTNIRYFASQSWPFPNSLMLGFTAEYASGEAAPDGEELDSLGWFPFDCLPEIPPEGSIARRIIDDFIKRSSSAVDSCACKS